MALNRALRRAKQGTVTETVSRDYADTWCHLGRNA